MTYLYINDIMYLYDVIFLDIFVLHNIISLIWVSIGCFRWTVSDGFRCSEQAEVIAEVYAISIITRTRFGCFLELG